MKKKLVGQIYETSQYDLFKLRKDNRPISELNVQRKIKSIKSIGQRIPIVVDSHYQVIDGQHRLESCKKLKIPVRYTVDDRAVTTENIVELQGATVRWNDNDHAKSFANLGNEHYKQYLTFRELFPEFSHSCVLTLLTNNKVRNFAAEKEFTVGRFEVKSYNKAKQTAEMLKKIGQHYDGYNRRSFVLAFLSMMISDQFSFERLMRKLVKRRRLLMDFSRMEDYLDTLQKIYNWNESKKVAFV